MQAIHGFLSNHGIFIGTVSTIVVLRYVVPECIFNNDLLILHACSNTDCLMLCTFPLHYWPTT